MFKIGQKVRVKQWSEMPQELAAVWGENFYAGQAGVIVSKNDSAGYEGYDVKLDGNKNSCFCLKEELEPFVRVGEQLLFDFVKE